MAITQNTFTGNGSNLGPFSFTFKWLESTDIKVTVGGVLKTAGTHYNLQALNYTTKDGGQVLFTAGNAPANNAAIRIYRDTDDSALSATFFSGSAIRAQDLNDDFTQTLYSTQEVKARYLDRQSGAMESTYVPNTSTSVVTKGYMETNYGVIDEVGFTRWRQTASAAQTTFTGAGSYGGVLSYVPTKEQVYLNGALQQRDADYSASNGTSIVFNVALTAGDVVDVVCVNNLTASTVSDAANISYGGQFTGQSTRTVAAKLSDVVSVKDFGAVGDGVADDRSAFLTAHTATPAGVPILVPSGTYYISSNITCTYRRFTFEGAQLTSNSGKLVGALIERTDPATGGRQFGVGNSLQYGSYYRFGRNGGGPIGLTVGGGEPEDGDWGNVVFPDFYGGWTTIMPGRYLSSAELAIQPASAAGAATLTNGGNTVTRVSGAGFTSDWVGRRIYLGQGIYKVSSVNPGAGTLVVTNLNGSAVSFTSGDTVTFIVTGVLCQGIANVSGTTVTRVSGDPFVPLTNTEYIFKVNGVAYTVSSVTDGNTIVLTTSPGTLTGATYEIWTSVDNISSAVRVHRVSGAGFEENLTIQASASGNFHMYSAGGAGRQYPFYIGTGYYTSGLARRQVALQADGSTTLGGDADKCSLRIEDRNEVASDYFTISGANTGSATPSISVNGAATDINIGLSTKGNGSYIFNSNGFGGIQFEISPLSGSTSRLGIVGSIFDQPKLYAAGAAANIDIFLQPKGTGRVLIGPYTASGTGTIIGHIEVKDSTGVVRKLAVIS